MTFLEKRKTSPKSADIVRKLKQKVTESEKTAFRYKGIVEYYETLFPWLKDYIDVSDGIINDTLQSKSKTLSQEYDKRIKKLDQKYKAKEEKVSGKMGF